MDTSTANPTAKDLAILLGPLADWYADPTVMEIIVDAPGHESVVRIGTANKLTDIGPVFSSQTELRQVIDDLMALGGVALGADNTIGEVRLAGYQSSLTAIPPGEGTEDWTDAQSIQYARAVAVIPPTSVASAHLFIEKIDPYKFTFTWEKLLQWGVLSPAAYDLIASAIRYQGANTNILVVGDTRNAKNYLLNLLAESLPAEERVVVVADSFQLPVARHKRRIHLEPSSSTAQRLLDVAAHMHADWLVTGDLRGAEALTLVQLLNSGHHGLTTLCAQGPLEALTQIETLCLAANPSLGLPELRSLIASALPLIIFMKSYTLPDHRIKVTQLVEVAGVKNDRYILQPLFIYDNDQGTLQPTEAGSSWAERARNRIVMG